MYRAGLNYPMRGAHFVSLEELGFSASRLDISHRRFNNHHMAWTARAMSRLAITQVFRDLNRNQRLLPIETHVDVHDRFDPIITPKLGQILDVIDECYQEGELLRYGSARSPVYKPITPELMTRLGFEYGALV